MKRSERLVIKNYAKRKDRSKDGTLRRNSSYKKTNETI